MRKLSRAIVSGEVQGVGYRYFVVRQSQNFQVTGFVKNLQDGSVEIQAEGEEEEVKRFLQACSVKEAWRRVEEMKVEWRPAEGGFKGFRVLP